MSAKKEETVNPTIDKTSIWQQRFENREAKMRRTFERARKNYDIMYAVQNTTNMAAWKAKVYIPVLANKAWELIARMSDVVPYFNISIQNELEINDQTGNFELGESASARQKRIEAKLHHDYSSGCDDEPMKLKVFDPLVDAVVAGTGYAYTPWDFGTKTTYGRKFKENGSMDNSKRVEKKTKEGKNGFEGINFFDVFPSDAQRWQLMPYLIIRQRLPMVDMKKAGVYKNLNRVDTSTPSITEFQLYNEARNRVLNEEASTSVDDTVDTVTFYSCLERTENGIELTVYADGRKKEGKPSKWVEIRSTSIPYWHNRYPVVPFYLRKKSYSVLGESLFENNSTMQSATNDLFNHYLDNWSVSIESMLMYEDGTLTNDFVIEPGGEITFTGEAPKQFKFPEPNPQQLSLVMNVLEKGIDAATFSPYATGTPSDGNDKTQGTKYGVQKISEAATTKIGFFRDNFKQSMKTVGRNWLSNLQQFEDVPKEIRRTVNGRIVPDIIMPSDYQGDIEMDIDDDSMTPLSTQDKRAMADEFLGGVTAMQKAAMEQAAIFKSPSDIPRFNFHEILHDRAMLFSVKDYDRYILDSSVEIPQDPPVDNTKELLNFSYKDAPDDVKAQIEEMYGLQPSAMHDTNLTHNAIKMGAEQAQLMQGALDGTGSTTGPTDGNQQTGAIA